MHSHTQLDRRGRWQSVPYALAVGVLLAIAGAGCAAVTPAATSAVAAAETDTGTADGGDAAASASDAAVAADLAAAVDVAPAPPAVAAYPGECPNFNGTSVALAVGGINRNLLITMPSEPNGAGVLFLWHGLGDNAKNFNGAFGAKQLAAKLNVIVVTPDVCCNTKGAESCCSQLTGWHFTASPESDVGIFDGALSCLGQQFNVDRKRVYTMGFSAGGLWSTWLVMNRSQQLAAAAVLSGGINDYNPWTLPTAKVPVIDASGGPGDQFGGGVVDFQTSTEVFNKKLRAAGHFVVHCQHQQGHTITSEIASYAAAFLADHAWTPDGTSPLAAGLPKSAPSACKILP